jgi:hypothetical protein
MKADNRRFPHLLPQDIVVWKRFLHLHEDDYDHFDYDVRVGQGQDPGPQLDPKYRQMGIELSKRRIDAVGHRPDALHIFEITTRAGIHAIGQLTTYPILYHQTFHPLKPLVPILICSSLGPDVKTALDIANLQYFIFPD